MLTFDPPRAPTYPGQYQPDARVVQAQSEKGYVRSRPHGIDDPLVAPISWRGAGRSTYDYLASFFADVRAAAFLWQPYWYERVPVHRGPALSAVAGGSLSARTYFVAWSWRNSADAGETTVSAESTLAVPANELLKVALPVFPTMADEARIYAGTSSGSLTLQTTLDDRSWTEPTSGLVAGASPPTENTLRRPLIWVVDTAPIFRPIRCNRWDIDVTFREVFFP